MPSKPMLIPTSIVTFYTAPHSHPNQQDELFLLYSKGFEEGRARGIHRDGIGSPWMWDEDIKRRITDPEEQRRGTWLIDSGLALKLEKEAIEGKKQKPEVLKWIQREIGRNPQEVLDEWIKELNSTPDYISEFEKLYGPKGYKIVGMQGCGNLTMNGWFIGFLNSDFTQNETVFLHRKEEPFEARQYTCLVKSKESKILTIELLRFNIYKRRVFRVVSERTEEDITEQIEFAVFGQQLVREGQLVDFRNIVTQFEDIRHLFKLPNINPNTELKDTRQTKRPRMLFGDDRNDDVWFGEREMTKPGKEDLLRHALTEPILLDRQFETMGAGWDLIEDAFSAPTGGGYRELKGEQSLYTPRARGEWRRYSETMVEIYLQRNVYAYTMLGLDYAGNIIASAAGGLAGRVGQTLEGMAQNMISAGAKDVLLLDEGNDVFQRLESGYTVEPRRGRIRAVFMFAQKHSNVSGEETATAYNTA